MNAQLPAFSPFRKHNWFVFNVGFPSFNKIYCFSVWKKRVKKTMKHNKHMFWMDLCCFYISNWWIHNHLHFFPSENTIDLFLTFDFPSFNKIYCFPCEKSPSVMSLILKVPHIICPAGTSLMSLMSLTCPSS